MQDKITKIDKEVNVLVRASRLNDESTIFVNAPSLLSELEDEETQETKIMWTLKLRHTSKEGTKYSIYLSTVSKWIIYIITCAKNNEAPSSGHFMGSGYETLHRTELTAVGDIAIEEDSDGTVLIYQVSSDGEKEIGEMIKKIRHEDPIMC